LELPTLSGVVVTAPFYANPPAGWKPEGWVPKTAVAKAAGTYEYTLKEAMGTWQVWALWLMLFLNVSAGIMIISQASPIAQQQVKMTAIEAGKNGGTAGHFQRRRAFPLGLDFRLLYFLLYLVQAGSFFYLPRIDNQTALFVAFAVIYLCYGGGFGTMPSFTADYFGARFMGGNLRMDPAGLGGWEA
jgi:MFS transporter, OFA family, oxalate/formate antiporter